uniref:Ribonuclease H-like domain-containing protein n=1 Tax=Tanacetum cinerariifolium TaxID=118510 RepID=A0A6L2MKE0_TANCI|nr:ribonuclease H-like domain-containing protein [Tanacetum cinerariifolium]
MTKNEAGNEVEVPPVTAQQILARTRERKAKSTMLMAIPDEHLARFHEIKDAKTLWAAIKPDLVVMLSPKRCREIACVSTEDVNQKFLRSLPSAWSNISLIMSNTPGIDNLDIDDLYNNLKVYEADIKGSSESSSNSQNMAFVFAESTNSTNELNVAYSVSTATCHSSQLDNEDLKQIDQDDLEEMDLKWDCRTAKNPGNMGRDAGNAGCIARDNGKRHAREEDEKALVVQGGLGYDSQFNEKEVLDVKAEEVTEIVFDNRTSDKENSLANDRFKKGEGFHAVPPSLTGNYMPPKPDLSFAGLDDSIYKFKISETVTSLSKYVKDAFETSTAFIEKPKEVRTSAPLIQDWDTDSDNDSVFRPKHIPAKINFVKVDRIAKKYVLLNNVRKGTGYRESRPVWNNVQRINHQNKFAPTAVFTRSGRILVSAAKPKAAASTSVAKPVNIARPKQSVNFSNSRSTFHKSHSPKRRTFYNATTHLGSHSTKKVNTARSKAVSVVKRNRVTAVKASAGCVWRPRVNEIDKISKDNRWICTRVDYVDQQGRLKHMTGNKAYLADYQEINDGGFVAFGSSSGKITGKEGKAAQSHLALVTKHHNKTPYELLNDRSPRLDFIRPFGCPVTILNTLDPLGKFEGKADEGNQTDKNAGPQDTNGNVGAQDNVDVGKDVFDQHYIMLPLWSSISSTYKSSDDKPKDDTGSKTVMEPVNKEDQAYRGDLVRLMSQEKEASDAADSLSKEFEQGCMNQRGTTKAGSTNSFNNVSNPVNAASTSGPFSAGGPSSPYPDAFIPDDTLLHFDQDDS